MNPHAIHSPTPSPQFTRSDHLAILRDRASRRHRSISDGVTFWCHRCVNVHHRPYIDQPVSFSDYHLTTRSCDSCEVELGQDRPVYVIANLTAQGYWHEQRTFVQSPRDATRFTFDQRLSRTIDQTCEWRLLADACPFPKAPG